MGKSLETLTDTLDRAVVGAETLIAVVLVGLLLWGLGALVFTLYSDAVAQPLLSSDLLHLFLDRILLLFVVVELFRIAVAYLHHERVLLTVFEAALVAIARKLVLYEFKVSGLEGAIALGVLLVSVAGAAVLANMAISSREAASPRTADSKGIEGVAESSAESEQG